MTLRQYFVGQLLLLCGSSHPRQFQFGNTDHNFPRFPGFLVSVETAVVGVGPTPTTLNGGGVCTVVFLHCSRALFIARQTFI